MRELIEDTPTRCGSARDIEACRVAAAPELRRIVVAVDPPASSGERLRRLRHRRGGAGRRRQRLRAGGRERASRLTPARWARRAVDLYHRLEADRIVAEVNQGGDMVEAVIRQAGRERAGARRCGRAAAKSLRAEPVAALYEQGQREACRGVPRARGRDVRLRARRAFFGALAGPARRAGLGALGADADAGGEAAGAGDMNRDQLDRTGRQAGGKRPLLAINQSRPTERRRSPGTTRGR